MDETRIPVSNAANSCSSASCPSVAFWNLEIGETIERAIKSIGTPPIERSEKTITAGGSVELVIFQDPAIPGGALTILAFCGRIVYKKLMLKERALGSDVEALPQAPIPSGPEKRVPNPHLRESIPTSSLDCGPASIGIASSDYRETRSAIEGGNHDNFCPLFFFANCI